jgi:hypothetical protein
MVINSPKLLAFLDKFAIEQCQQVTPDADLGQIRKNLEVFSFNEGVSTVFYLQKYIMTIDWKIVN